jgi:hypothetical protein
MPDLRSPRYAPPPGPSWVVWLTLLCLCGILLAVGIARLLH